MRQVGRHVDGVARFADLRFASEGKFAFTGQNLNERVLRRGVLGQFLAGRKRGKLRSEGKTYLVRDGDVIEILHSS